MNNLLKKVLTIFLKRKIKKALADNFGEPDLYDSTFEGGFLEDVTGGSYFIINEKKLIGSQKHGRSNYFVFEVDDFGVLNYVEQANQKILDKHWNNCNKTV